jgi:hypothetical protein
MTEQDDLKAFERRTKRVFDESVAALDAATRSRLTQARYTALGERRAPARDRGWRWSLLPGGVAAATALGAWLVVSQAPSPPEAVQQASLGDLEILLGEEDLEMLEELEFYGWLGEQPEFADVSDSVG